MHPIVARLVPAAAVVAVGVALAVPTSGGTVRAQDATACAPGGPPVEIAATAQAGDAKTYRLHPVEVAPGTTRVEVGYAWSSRSPLPDTPLTQSVVDLGVWDADGVDAPAGFRGWSGSRQGKIAEGQDPIWIQADSAERGYRPGPIEPGTWTIEAGIAAVAPGGLDYQLTVTCSAPATGPTPTPDPVAAAHVADPAPGWYAGDFHMHGYHSNPEAPPYDDGDRGDVDSFVDYARAAGLDFLPVTEYVTTVHHDELGPVQRANPDLVIWPGREIITYFGHATVFGETPSTVEYRHGLDDISLGDIQADTVADGALFGLAHPTIFPTEVFASFCRGCEFTLEGAIDADAVTTFEVVTGPILVDSSALGLPDVGVRIQNPFVLTAIDEWQRHLLAGHRMTAVSGSDDKLGPELGTVVTRVFAESLSRPALRDGVTGGHAYIQTMGADGPTIELTATAPDGQTAIIGDTLSTDQATMTARVRGAAGQVLTVSSDGLPMGVVPITSDDFTHTFTATAGPLAGPLGSFWRVDVLDPTVQALSIITNPIFLRPVSIPETPETDPPPSNPTVPTGSPAPAPAPSSGPDDRAAVDDGVAPARTLPRTGGTPTAAPVVLAVAGLAVAVRRRA